MSALMIERDRLWARALCSGAVDMNQVEAVLREFNKLRPDAPGRWQEMPSGTKEGDVITSLPMLPAKLKIGGFYTLAGVDESRGFLMWEPMK